ncbi:hypothetical protein GCK32_005898 [Trichostrongylus colubriformis]|uniref:SCP domain-containing protein n=1 Tax=Trichostrongylus colubriformis TaxID=6319 RepID=A0AAN8FI42_TRICO
MEFGFIFGRNIRFVKMHQSIFSLICCILLFAEGLADENNEKCNNNLPNNVRSALIKALEEHPGNVDKKKLTFSCDLAMLAFDHSYADTEGIDYFKTFDRTSTFDFYWKESFERALQRKEDGQEGDKVDLMWGLIRKNKIGCAVEIKTNDDDDGHHNCASHVRI